jgi:predicted acyl esterase
MKANKAAVSQPRDLELVVEKDVRIPMRDGAFLYADVFRPSNETENESENENEGGEETFPAIMNISVYRKTSCGFRRRT